MDMAVKFILSDYVEEALKQATYDKLDDNSFVGRIPSCQGVIAFGETLRECGTRHQFMIYKQCRLTIPSNLEYSVPQLKMMIREIENILG
jgi:hypothetical protein